MMAFGCRLLCAWMMQLDRIPYVKSLHRGFVMGKKIKKKKKVKWMKRLLLVVGITVWCVLIYLVIMLVLLIGQTIEEQLERKPENLVTQEVVDTSGKDKVHGDDIEQNDTTTGNQVLSDEEKVREKIRIFAREHHLSVNDYPEELVESFIANPEKEEFILNYPLKKDTYSKRKLTEYIGQSDMPLLLQWNETWGYYPYGNGVIGVLGCGPTCVSMVALHLLQDAKFTPIYMADFAMQNGYYVEGVGTSWNLMTEGARRLGLKVKEVSLVENLVVRHLKQGRPIICAMGPGEFTQSGHFIVLAGEEDGKIRINDCNSKRNSEKLWEFEEFKDQIRNMWVYSVR